MKVKQLLHWQLYTVKSLLSALILLIRVKAKPEKQIIGKVKFPTTQKSQLTTFLGDSSSIASLEIT